MNPPHSFNIKFNFDLIDTDLLRPAWELNIHGGMQDSPRAESDASYSPMGNFYI